MSYASQRIRALIGLGLLGVGVINLLLQFENMNAVLYGIANEKAPSIILSYLFVAVVLDLMWAALTVASGILYLMGWKRVRRVLAASILTWTLGLAVWILGAASADIATNAMMKRSLLVIPNALGFVYLLRESSVKRVSST